MQLEFGVEGSFFGGTSCLLESSWMGLVQHIDLLVQDPIVLEGKCARCLSSRSEFLVSFRLSSASMRRLGLRLLQFASGVSLLLS